MIPFGNFGLLLICKSLTIFIRVNKFNFGSSFNILIAIFHIKLL
jgi:hypothetical protein